MRITGEYTVCLHLELLRIDLIIRRAVRRWQQAGQDLDEKFRGLHINFQQVQDLLALPIGGNWGSINPPTADDESEYSQNEALIREQIAEVYAEASRDGSMVPLLELKERLGLSDFEYDALLICLAPAVDSRYEKIFGFLQDDVTQKYASIGLIFDLLLPDGMQRMCFLESFTSSPLNKYHLLQPINNPGGAGHSLLRQAYLPAPEIITWLIGAYHAPAGFEGAVHLSDTAESVLPAGLLPETELNADLIREASPVVILYGQDDLQQTETARYLSAALNQPLLTVDISKVAEPHFSDGTLIDYVLRDALLNGAIPQFINWDALPAEAGLQQALFQKINLLDIPVILQSRSIWQINRNGSRHIKPVQWVKCDLPNSTQRFQLWRNLLSDEDGPTAQEIDILSGQFTLTSNQIRNAVYTARDTALQQNRTITTADLYDAARMHSSHHLESLAVKIPPRYGWNDIVLPEDEMTTLHEIAETVRWRSVVLEDWGVGQRLMPNAGISALFAGPSGTGKTLAAQVIAAELKMDLYKIDLSTVVSKYIGETEKNLERIFTQAHNSNSILFFDEADAIFGKRSEVKDAHDRYANIEVVYLLQRMETYDGIVILATNLRANLDDAFTRRLQFVVDFPFPDEEERLKIWNVLFPPGVPREPGIDFASLAHRFKLTGGSIRNIIIGAAFLAASQSVPVSTPHILRALRREMQNMGRLINEKDVTMLIQEDIHGQ